MKTWSETSEDKRCPNNEVSTEVSTQIECQNKCGAQSSCVGITYSHKNDGIRKWCYMCKDDILKDASNDFGFYRRPGKNNLYSNKHIKKLLV